MKTRKGVATLFILGALLLSTVTPVLGAPNLADLSAFIEYEVTPCDYLEVTFTGSAEEGEPPYEFDWDFGDGEDPDTGETVTHTYEAAGTYTITLTVTDDAEVPATAEETLTLGGLEASASADPRLAEPDDDITFTGSATGGEEPYAYEWDFGDGTGTGTPITHTYTATGIYDVALTVTDDNGCTAEDTVKVAVGEPSEHTLSNLIAAFFILPPELIDALRERGWGYGEIAMAYFAAQLSGEDIEDIIALREGEGGSGWGQIMRGVVGFAGLHGYNLGLIVSGREIPTPTQNLADFCGLEVQELLDLVQETKAKFSTIRMTCRLAQEVDSGDVTLQQIIEMHQDGMTWRQIREESGLFSKQMEALARGCGMEGNIEDLASLIDQWGRQTVKRACRLAQASGVSVTEVLEMLDGGLTWDQIKEDSGLVPERGSQEQGSQGQGHDKGDQGQGHGKGQQGQPQGKGKGPKQ
jgi:PKD repeat protein